MSYDEKNTNSERIFSAAAENNSAALSNNRTRRIDKVILRGNVLKKIIHIELYKTFRKVLDENYKKIEDEYFSQQWIPFIFDCEIGYWNKDTSYAVVVQSRYENMNVAKPECYFGVKRAGFNKKNMQKLFGDSCPSKIMTGIRSSYSRRGNHYIGFENGSYCVESKSYVDWCDYESIFVGAARIELNEFKRKILSNQYVMLEDGILKRTMDLLDGRSILEVGNSSQFISENEVDKLLEILQIDRAGIEREVRDRAVNDFTLSSDSIDFYMNEVLSCDKMRADLEVYDKKCLEDVNSGHWELWIDKTDIADGQVTASIEKPLIARNPEADIREDGLIGIDFGTKSTIVSKRDGREKIDLLRVGTGQLNKKAVVSHYENPTIMEFINLEKFISDYNERLGRPETNIDDLRVSHIANSDLKSCTISDNFYSFFYDIKQWCGDTDRNIKIVDQNGMEKVLPAFVNLNESEFNPLELYAYYLGLYINNMRNGIYLDYVLSFPVTYERTVKEKILESFTKGLKKSLPECILANDKVMSKFRVRQGVSEPAAYAITALQGYGFEPEDDENVLYSIFDFGGGTTDFDFGLWRCADENKRDERRFDYVIEHFGSEGDKYLGGENLLELLAFEIFKANADLLGKRKAKNREKQESKEEASAGFSFSKPKECDAFPGSEILISNSQEARRNTKQLMEALRPFWEGIIGIEEDDLEEYFYEDENNIVTYNGYIFRDDDECKFPIKDEAIEVDLFDKDGNRKAKQKLYIKNEEYNIDVNLTDILEKRIERGISNFFTSIVRAFRNESAVRSKADGIQIFLAGNSSKSPILKKLFDKYIKQQEGGYEYYHLFPPLGTAEAFAKQKERNVKNPIENDITAPTGKTGVAYGLIAGREGGKIKVISEIKADAQTKFRFNIGIEKRGKFRMVLDRTLVNYGQWVCLIDAGSEDFEIYFTSQPNASKMLINETGIYNKRCRLPYVDEDADVYIRCVEDSPEDIEYCISKGEPSEHADVVRIHLGE